jgi:hypothetical protein
MTFNVQVKERIIQGATIKFVRKPGLDFQVKADVPSDARRAARKVIEDTGTHSIRSINSPYPGIVSMIVEKTSPAVQRKPGVKNPWRK